MAARRQGAPTALGALGRAPWPSCWPSLCSRASAAARAGRRRPPPLPPWQALQVGCWARSARPPAWPSAQLARACGLRSATWRPVHPPSAGATPPSPFLPAAPPPAPPTAHLSASLAPAHRLRLLLLRQSGALTPAPSARATWFCTATGTASSGAPRFRPWTTPAPPPTTRWSCPTVGRASRPRSASAGRHPPGAAPLRSHGHRRRRPHH